MAQRQIFICDNSIPFNKERMIEFEYHSGFSPQQKQKSILSLHKSANETIGNLRILEVSRNCPISLGKSLSAFNLTYHHANGEIYTVESVFQSSKVFEQGGPYKDLLTAPSIVSKKDPRIRESGKVIGFEFLEQTFPTEPKTLFYDWIYINALNQHKELHEELLRYNAFTDIEFNPKKSLNCQARSVATFVSLKNNGLLDDFLKDINVFKKNVFLDTDIVQTGTQISFF